jgi:hypothetical protein
LGYVTGVVQAVGAIKHGAVEGAFVRGFGAWVGEDVEGGLSGWMVSSRDLSGTGLERGQIVAATVEAARRAGRRSSCIVV